MLTKPRLTFGQAMRKAEGYIARKENLDELLKKAGRKAERNYDFLLSVWESLQTLVRLILAWLNGKYRSPAATVLMSVAAIIYFVNPYDFIPDSIPVLGLVDDASVITFVVRANAREVSRFRNWEGVPPAAFTTLKSRS
jgi:uncharacterized membrane protein YkvA (DUF1232 family)